RGRRRRQQGRGRRQSLPRLSQNAGRSRRVQGQGRDPRVTPKSYPQGTVLSGLQGVRRAAYDFVAVTRHTRQTESKESAMKHFSLMLGAVGAFFILSPAQAGAQATASISPRA